MEYNYPQGTRRTGVKVGVISNQLFNTIRERLNLTKEQLTDKQIRETIHLMNKEIGNWIIENTEGIHLHKYKGVLAVSKYLPPELRSDRDEKVKIIENIAHITESRRAELLKRYSKVQTVPNGQQIALRREFVPQLNTHSLYYTYKIMWFNKRNCDFRKALSYQFEANRKLKLRLKEKILAGKDYYEWNFSDFHYYKLRPIN